MKIKSLGFTSFLIDNDKSTIVTDPLFPKEIGLKIGKVEAEIAIISDKKHLGKLNIVGDTVTATKREGVLEITGCGEFESAEFLIQRPMGMPYYVIDSGYTRIVYVGLESKSITKEMVSDLGDVEVLILPVGDSKMFPDFEMLQDIISEIDPTILVPCGYSEKGIDEKLSLKTKEEFLHHFGYSNFREEKTLKVTGKAENDEKVMDIVFLNK
ncbi:MBL fold metallo-hydrolase [Candidatus Dojkabacteria bacterium]|jgi:L-ascorbate metabolism protein UlaG (beta-lactamase superfamily)|nr:MBL fold metallo-hydrolase [Candidatus Dojkabacteria bacterium]